jgi:hypothetical protein
METAKKDAKTIKLATGWERGADGKWRYEIPDAEWADGWYDIVKNGGTKRLSDVVENKELFDAYPELKNVAVILDDLEVIYGSYSNKVITLNRNSIGKTDMLSVMAHEIQHAIQDIEGFARGGNPDLIEIYTAKDYNDAATFRFFLDKWLKENNRKVRTNTSPFYGAMNDFLKTEEGKSWNYYKNIAKIKFLAYDSNREDLIKYRDEEVRNPSLTPYEQYRRFSGEVEARNVEARMNMTAEERRASLAAETEDVAREDQIFIYDALKESQMSEATNLKAANEAFNKELDNFVSGAQKGDLHLGVPLGKLQAAGIRAEEITITPKTLKEHLDKHGLTVEDLKGLAKAIQNPIMVYEWGTKAKSTVIITELTTKDGKKITVALKGERSEKKLSVNEVASIHGKEARRFLDEMQNAKEGGLKDALRWVEKEKALNWLGLVPPKGASSQTNQELNSAAKVIQNFENPTLTETSNNGDNGDNKDSRDNGDSGDNTQKSESDTKTIRFQTAQNDKKNPPKPKPGESVLEYAKKLLFWNAGRTDLLNEKVGAVARDEQLSLLKKIRKSLSEQKGELEKSAQAIKNFAKHLLDTTTLHQMSGADIDQILTAIKNASTKTDILDGLNRIFDIVIDKQLAVSEAILDKYLNLKVSDKNQSGVKVAKTVDDNTRVIVETAKKYVGSSVADIKDEISKLEDKRQDADELKIKQLENQLTGLNIAMRYAEVAGRKKKDIEEINNNIRDELETIKQNQEERTDKNGRVYHVAKDGKQGNIKAARANIKALEGELREAKEELRKGIDGVSGDLSKIIKSGKIAKVAFDAQQKERKHKVYSESVMDLAGVKPNIHAKKKRQNIIQGMLESLGAPLHSFAYELRKYGRNAINGEGYLFNHYVPGIIHSSQNEYKGLQEAFDRMDGKSEELFGKSWIRVMNDVSNKNSGISVHVGQGEDATDIELTNGNGLYIYLVNKMNDGKVKLRKMGILEEDVERIAEKLPPKLIQLGEWMQNELLPSLREKYNKTHLKVFGTQMSEIEYYFPLRILQESIHEEVEINKKGILLPSTVTGSLISRVRNTKPIDISNTDAMSLIIEHVKELEHWNAYIEITQDINTLLSSKSFRNKIESLHEGNYDTFFEAAQVAVGVYTPQGYGRESKRERMEAAITSGVKLIATSKINLRLNTALKQVLAFPAFITEAGDPYFLARFAKNIANPKGSWDWAMKNLPDFEKRWESRQAGNEKLDMSKDDIAKWLKELSSKNTRIGMAPNAFVDALVCAIGAKTVYESKLAKYKKRGIGRQSTAVMPRTAKSVSEAQGLIKPLIGKPITNDKLGITATISGNSLGKLGSQSATDKSVSPALHAKAIANIDILFQNAEFDIMHKDEKHREGIEQIHRLGSLMFDETSGEYIPVMITVKEFNNDRGNRIYTVEAVDIEKTKSAGQLVGDNQNESRQTPIADFNTKIQQLIETAKQPVIQKALDDATVAYNETQQSAESLFMSAMQNDKTFLATTSSLFNNQNFAMGRKLMTAARNVHRITTRGKQMVEFRRRQLISEGVSEENAEKFAARDVRHSLYKSLAQISMYGYGLQALWRIGNNWIYLLFGGDDDEKDKMLSTSLWGAAIAPIRGFVGGASAEELLDQFLTAANRRRGGSIFAELPMVQDTKALIDGVAQAFKDEDLGLGLWKIANFASNTVGVDLTTISNIAAGLEDLVRTNKDLTWQQVALDFSLIINAPNSQTKKLAEELKTGDVDAFIKEYNAFKSKYGPTYRLKDEEPVRGGYYRKRFSHLKTSLEKKIEELNEADKKSGLPKGSRTPPYERVKKQIKQLEVGFDAHIKKFEEMKKKTGSDDFDYQINKLKTKKAKTLIPEVMKLLDEFGVKY